MKRVVSVLISVFAAGSNILAGILLFALPVMGAREISADIGKIHLECVSSCDKRDLEEFRQLIQLKEGEAFNLKLIRSSMANLYKTGYFSNIDVKYQEVSTDTVDLYVILHLKRKINNIKISCMGVVNQSALKKAIFSVRKGMFLEDIDLDRAAEEIHRFLNSRGYFNPDVSHEVIENSRSSAVDLHFRVRCRKVATVKELVVILSGDGSNRFKDDFRDFFSTKKYIPYKFQRNIEKVKGVLKKAFYFYPDVRLEENFLDPSKSQLHLKIIITPGFKYVFRFRGIGNKWNLISSIWEEKRFEKWAEKESRALIQNFLNTNGYLNAVVTSSSEVKGHEKHFTFNVAKNRKYTLGRIKFNGNSAFSSRRLRDVIKTDDKVFNRLFWINSDMVLMDRELIKFFYHFNGYPSAKIDVTPSFDGERVNLDFNISEGRKISIDSIAFQGNRFMDDRQLFDLMVSKSGGPFVQQTLNRDLDNIRRVYLASGYDDVSIDLHISPDNVKKIEIHIDEQLSHRMGHLITIGASDAQKNLIKKLFPMEEGDLFDRQVVNIFQSDLENSVIFNEIEIEKIHRNPTTIDLLIHVVPDRGRYYGVGIGWEEQKLGESFAEELLKGLRGTLEYQERNIFNSYSSLSAIFQLGIERNRRLVVSYDTPYFLKTKLDASLRIFQEDEVFATYKFNRIGLSESLIKRFSARSFLMTSLNYYKTTLTDLKIPENDIDRLDDPFDTAMLNFSYVVENRDDPFNPSRGGYFSSDLRFGIPVSDDLDPFYKLLLRYQKNYKFTKNGVLSLSLRNGFTSDKVSVTERFFAGDIRTFRGTGNLKLGPVAEVDDDSWPIGGSALFLLNMEATFPVMIVPFEDLYYSLFADIGNVYEKAGDFSLNSLETAIGFSIKYKTPLGPFQVSFAWRLREGAQNDFAILWGIGNAF